MSNSPIGTFMSPSALKQRFIATLEGAKGAITLVQISKETGISSSTLSRFKLNGRALDSDNSIALSKWLNGEKTPEEICYGQGIEGALKAIEQDPKLSIIDCIALKELLTKVYQVLVDRQDTIERWRAA